MAIMSCALVENTLVGSIVLCLEDASEAAKLFDDVRGPFNTFYAQIVAGQALGLYGKDIADMLHSVRQVRNRFAHDVLSLTFDDPEIAAKCKRLGEFEYGLRSTRPKVNKTRFSRSRDFYEFGCLALTTELMRAGNEKLKRKTLGLELQVALAEAGKANLSEFLDLIPTSLKDSG